MFILPPLSAVLARIWENAVGGELWINTAVTLYRAIVGFLIASAGGIVLGLAMSRSALARWFFDPIISVGFPMPKIAFLPIVILWLGLYDLSKISMVVFDAIFPVVTATIIGIRGVEKELIWSARNMGASDREVLWQVVLPAALPQILTGLQVALPIALIVAVVCEMAMGGYGLGGAMMTASRFADFARRVRRHRRDRSGRLRAGQGHGGAAPPLAALAPGGQRADHGVAVGRLPLRHPPPDALIFARALHSGRNSCVRAKACWPHWPR